VFPLIIDHIFVFKIDRFIKQIETESSLSEPSLNLFASGSIRLTTLHGSHTNIFVSKDCFLLDIQNLLSTINVALYHNFLPINLAKNYLIFHYFSSSSLNSKVGLAIRVQHEPDPIINRVITSNPNTAR